MFTQTNPHFRLLLALVLAISLLLPVAANAGPLQQDAPPAPIRLQSTTFNPGQGQQPAIPPGLSVASYNVNQRGYYIVQFAGPIQQTWKDQVVAAGGELLGYIPDFAFKVRMNPAQAGQVTALDAVSWVGIFQPAYKLSPNVDVSNPGLYRVRVERGAEYGLTTAAIVSSGAQIVSRSDNLLIVGADAAQVQALANVLDVAWIENYVLPQKHNEYGAGVILGSNAANANGYDGSTQIAAVADTGLGDGTVAGAHPDIPAGRIVSIHNWPGVTDTCFQNISDDGAIDVDSGHGTHTAVSVLGDGGVGGEGKSAAPAARLVFQATENWATISNYCQILGGWPANGYFLTGLPEDLRNMYQQAYNDGARIHSNSWGSSLAGEYTVNSANTDDFVWNNPDMAITFSAGNEGVDANANGVVDNDSIGSPATAKNVITVGASENNRVDNWPCDTGLGYTSHDAYQPGETCDSMGGQNLLGTWGQRYGNSFTAEPLFSDVTAGNQEQMASWSSRGPTDDGRIKPDVVAPGTWILSGYSDLHQEGYEGDPVDPQTGAYQWDGWGMPLNADYKYMGGTSMSNPIAAGAATVVRDYYQKAYSHNASAALVKATMINSAVDLADENNDGVDDNDFPIPNVHEGWGRVNVAAATNGLSQYVENAAGLATGGSANYQFNIGTAGTPFKVTLVWSDFASTEAAAQNLVNDLDLVVTAPGGAQYRGNAFNGGWSQTGGSVDRVNNVENAYVQSAAAGMWSVTVSGFNVPTGPQPFALVVDGNFGAVDNPPSVAITSPADGATVSGIVNITADASDDNGITQVEFFVNGASIGVDTTPSYESSWDSTAIADGNHTITATATDTNGQTGSDSNSVTVDNVQDVTLHVGDLEGSGAAEPKNRWRAAVTITIHDSNEVAVSGAIVDGSWSDGASGDASCTTDAHGHCTVSKSNMKGNVSSVTFTVVNVTSNVGTYVQGNNHDLDEDSDGTSITVNQPGANTAPTVTINEPTDGATFASGATINFAGATNDAEDGDLTVNLVWSSNIDEQIGVGGSFSVALSDGPHTIIAEVTDSGGATSSDSIGITVGAAQTVEVHIGGLDGGGVLAPRNRWDATVSITVHDADENPVPNATIDGSWSAGASGGGSCVTDGSGICTVIKTNIKGNSSSVTFIVNSVTLAGSTYNAGANHDPDGDSNGTSITVLKP